MVWVNPYAHISILLENGAATGYAVTVVDKTFRLDLRKFSFDHFRGRLGSVTYQGAVLADHQPRRAALFAGARRMSYFETHYFGNPGGYLHYVLAWSDSSRVGHFELPPDGAEGKIGSDEQNEAARAYVHRFGRPNTVGVYQSEASATPAALDLDTYRLLPLNESAWLRLERTVIRFFRPF
ncbi:ETEC_3214 domain-containing protein [Kribbella sp. GL6]|uniref:ETEC_3214 domain-containing protein n=1 Tax=Kribbella sp. GL6 TaxID=3419765 RepID=UPI003CFCBE11